eukprot:CAMPEP_0184645018 /NCGR_PEP_ID=MMETSP0308-20130426/1590_1 /TAXON_ID=38269 /ORGANISM="Gloeochaete witrockiana, Strain SAG 46.84" /LENGTH=153 /DNA_ID=CAMNT_0027073801 /DNA_START=199 /DNA_END=657 /DNA_ORIENTATION=-
MHVPHAFNAEDEAELELVLCCPDDSRIFEGTLNGDEEPARFFGDADEVCDPSPDLERADVDRMPFIRTMTGTPLSCLGHQVAGQAPLLKREDGKVCKPLVTRERLFYEKIQRSHPEFLPFVPRFFGVSTVTLFLSECSVYDEKDEPLVENSNW